MSRDLPPGLAGYAKPISAILSWMPDWISQDTFDERVVSEDPMAVYISPYTKDSFIFGLNGMRQEALEVLFSLVRHKIVEVKRDEAGKMWYRHVA